MIDNDDLQRQIERRHLDGRAFERLAAEHEQRAQRVQEEAERLRAKAVECRQQVLDLRAQQQDQWDRQRQQDQPHPDGDMGRYDAFLAELRLFMQEDRGDVGIDIGRLIYSTASRSMADRQASLGDFLLTVARGFEQEDNAIPARR